jgi:hypothetical protein
MLRLYLAMRAGIGASPKCSRPEGRDTARNCDVGQAALIECILSDLVTLAGMLSLLGIVTARGVPLYPVIVIEPLLVVQICWAWTAASVAESSQTIRIDVVSFIFYPLRFQLVHGFREERRRLGSCRGVVRRRWFELV